MLTFAPRRRGRTYVSTGNIGLLVAESQRLQAEINKLQTQLDENREELLAHMNSRNLDVLQSGDCVVLRKLRHKWTYTAATEREMLALRNTQKWEQSQGLATDNPVCHVSITTRKP